MSRTMSVFATSFKVYSLPWSCPDLSAFPLIARDGQLTIVVRWSNAVDVVVVSVSSSSIWWCKRVSDRTPFPFPIQRQCASVTRSTALFFHLFNHFIPFNTPPIKPSSPTLVIWYARLIDDQDTKYILGDDLVHVEAFGYIHFIRSTPQNCSIGIYLQLDGCMGKLISYIYAQESMDVECIIIETHDAVFVWVSSCFSSDMTAKI